MFDFLRKKKSIVPSISGFNKEMMSDKVPWIASSVVEDPQDWPIWTHLDRLTAAGVFRARTCFDGGDYELYVNAHGRARLIAEDTDGYGRTILMAGEDVINMTMQEFAYHVQENLDTILMESVL